MSTRSFICMEVESNQYKTIYCHSDGYLSYNGILLAKFYNDRENVEKLLKLGDLSSLGAKINPDPQKPHGFDWDKRQEGVCVSYGRDRGEENVQAQVMTMRQLRNPDSGINYVYIFNKEGEWKYFKPGYTQGLRDLNEDLAAMQTDDQTEELNENIDQGMKML